MSDRRFVVAVTGASGAAYVGRLLEVLGASGAEIHLMVSKWGWRLIHDELGFGKGQLDELSGGYGDSIVLHNDNDVGAAPGSGSFVHDGMVILPCSANTLGRIASGMTENLVQRAAACCLKERRRLVLCHRETPLSLIEIENMAAVTRAVRRWGAPGVSHDSGSRSGMTTFIGPAAVRRRASRFGESGR